MLDDHRVTKEMLTVSQPRDRWYNMIQMSEPFDESSNDPAIFWGDMHTEMFISLSVDLIQPPSVDLLSTQGPNQSWWDSRAYLVGGLELCFPYIGNFIIPTDFHSIIFQRGRYGRSTTNQNVINHH